MTNDEAEEVRFLRRGKRKEAVLFIQNTCAVAKNIQAQSRSSLYANFIHNGLFTVITFALRHHDASVRVAGTDILVSLIDHDPHLVRMQILEAVKTGGVPLTDTLIELLLVEVDLGVKSQMADAIKILLDPGPNMVGPGDLGAQRAGQLSPESLKNRTAGGGLNGVLGNGVVNGTPALQPRQEEDFISAFYDESARRLFQPLRDLEHRPSMLNLSVHESSLFTHLVEVLCFFVRQHSYKSKLFILSSNLHARVAQLLACPQKHVKLTALKWFRTCIGLRDEYHNRQMIQHRLFEPILTLVEHTMPRNNLLNSACLELFEFILSSPVRQLVIHLAEGYRERLGLIGYVQTFRGIVAAYDHWMFPPVPPASGPEGDTSYTTQEGTPTHRIANGGRFHGLQEMDGDEEAYFDGIGDDEDDDREDEGGLPTKAVHGGVPLGASPIRPLVNYPDDDDEEDDGPLDLLASSPDAARERKGSSDPAPDSSAGPDEKDSTNHVLEVSKEPHAGDDDDEHAQRGRGRDRTPRHQQPQSPPEPLAMKRRRQDDEDDELGKLMGGHTKRRNSTASLASQAGKVQLDSSSSTTSSPPASDKDEGGHLPVLSPQSVPVTPPPPVTHGHTLRRKASLKAKNETPGRFSLKPIHLAAAAATAAKKSVVETSTPATNGTSPAEEGEAEGGKEG